MFLEFQSFGIGGIPERNLPTGKSQQFTSVCNIEFSPT